MIKNRTIKRTLITRNWGKGSLFLVAFSLIATLATAQPGGHPGGFPGGHPGGFPGGRPPMGDRNGGYPGQQGQQVKKKKIVTNGTTFKVTGVLKDSVKNEAVPFVNVSVLTKEDSTFVKGASSNFDGIFEVTEVPQGEFFLRISAIGYQTRWVAFKVENNTALGTIKLKEGNKMLSEVQIKADRPLYAMDGEKMVYNVSDDPSIQTGTTTDALQNAPGVEVDIEGNITLRGVSSVEIWVNDKPSKLTAENLKTYLETLPANALARIETITNPSAKYATTADAVINIITSAHIKKNHFISFGVNGATQPNVSPWFSYMWANERLSVNVFGGMRFSNRKDQSTGWSITRKDGLNPGTFDTVMTQYDTSDSWNKNLGANLSVNINYEVDSMTDLMVFTNGSFNNTRSFSDFTQFRDESWINKPIYWYNTTQDNHSQFFYGMMGAYLTHKFDREGHNIRIGVNGNMNGNNDETTYQRDYMVYDLLDQNKYYFTRSRSTSLGADVRYNRPYSKNGEMSYGLGFNHSNDLGHINRSIWEESTQDYTLTDSLRTKESSSFKNNVDLDVNWTHRFGGFTLELGLGGIYNQQGFQFDSPMDWAFLHDDTTFNYFLVQPSIHMSYRTKSMHNFKLNYTLKMRTPGNDQITTYRTYSEDGFRTGNRALTPYITHNAEAGWTKFFQMGSLGIEAYGRYSTKEIDNLTSITEEEDEFIGRIISYSMPYNMGSSWRYGTSMNATFRPSGFLNVRLYANLYNYGYSMFYDKLGETISNDKWSYSVRLNFWTKIFNQYQIHASANYSSPTIGLMSESKARYFVNCGVRSDFFKRKLSVYINVQDIFNWGYKIGSGNSNTNPYYLSDNLRKSLNSRYISAGVTFRFGKMELERSAKQGSETLESE